MTTDPRRARLVELLARGRGERTAEPEQGIAIVGLAARFPGPGGDGVVRFDDGCEAVDGTRALDAIWQQLRDGCDAITDIPADRWDAADPAFFVDDKAKAVASGRSYARRGGFLAGGIDRFDALLFGISPREAEMADPQERLFLETAWHAVEDAGLARERLMGRRVGVFAGAMFGHYQLWEGADAIANSSFGAIANRVSHVFDWRGPSIGLDTMCSASLTAIHLACEALRKGEIELALAGGVNLIVHPRKYQLLCQGRYASTDGRCRSFGAGGDGYVPGEGAGAVLLKPLARALADDDPIWGVIRGSAINHGGRSAGSGFTVPSPAAQASAIADALSTARLTPEDISYIEAHGTGTALGDPIEIASLTRAFGARSTLPVGSVKSNVGHLESAAGVAGLVKILLQMRHRMLVPSLLHSPGGALNPEIDFTRSPLRVQRVAEPWSAEGPLRAGLSAFGAGGSNAHVVVEEPPRRPDPPVAFRPALVVLSAQDEERLGVAARLLLDFVSGTELPLDGLAYTLQTGRDAMTARLAFVAEDLDALRTRLRAVVAGRDGPAIRGRAEPRRRDDLPAIEPAPTDDLDVLARRWVAGEAVRWEGLYRGTPPRRVRLPGYPFERARHWLVPKVPERPAPPPAAAQDGLFGPPSRDATGLRHRILPQEPLVRDHLFRGTPLLPAAAMVEMMRSAVRTLGADGEAGVLADVAWLRPVPVESAVEMLAVLRDEGPRSVVELRTVRADGDAVVNARARPAGPFARLTASAALPALRERLGEERDGAQLYAALEARGLVHGPAFRVIERFRTGQDEALATLRLPAEADRGGAVVWHPALLDGALQAAGAILAGQGAALPFAVDRVAGSGTPLPGLCFAHARRRTDAPDRIDVDVLDPDGQCLLKLDGLTVRSVPAPMPAPVAAAPASGDGAELRGRLLAALRALVAATLKLQPERLGEKEDFERFGLQSVHVMDITDALETCYGPVPRTWLFEHRTLAELADRLIEDRRDAVERHLGATPPGIAPARTRAASERAAPPAEHAGAGLHDVAVIGVAGRYPGARTLEAFWANLAAGRDCVTPVPEARWRTAAGGAGPAPSRWGGFLDDVDRFDARFFGISPREAELLDPQERLFLETAWQAIENAALLPAALDGVKVGVFVGVMYGLYQLHGPESTAAGRPLAPGAGYWSIANRVSSFFNLRGPSLAVDSACSSSLSAIHLACQALRTGEATVAIAGGVNVASHPQKYLQLAQMHFTSSDGRCRSFGAGGDGYVPGEGVGAVVLKPLAAALADRDPVWAVIRGSAVNHGGRTNGYTVPSPLAQAEVIRAALDAAGVAPESIDYVEAHGTGTVLGDPIEIAGLNRALVGRGRGSCALGSVKSNIGHLESAAAVAGLTKILLQMRFGEIAPSLHAAELNPHAAFDAGPCAVQHRLASWPAPAGRGRRAGLSSFGAGGSNGHIIVEEHASDRRKPFADRALVLLSARAEEGLKARAEDLRAWLDATKDVSLADLAHTLQVAREGMPERLAFVCRSVAELRDALDGFVERGEVGGWGWRGTVGGTASARLPQDAAGRARLTERLAEDGALDEAARHWVAGLDLARAMPADVEGVRRRLNLPPLRFSGPRFWVQANSPAPQEAAVEAATTASEPAAPVLLLAPRLAADPVAAMHAPAPVTMTVGLAPEETAALRAAQPERILAAHDAPSWRQQTSDDVDFDLRDAIAWARFDAMRDDGADRIVWRPSTVADDAAETCFWQLVGLLRHRAASGRTARLDLVIVGPGGPVLRAAAGLLRSAAVEMPNIRAAVASLDGAVTPAACAALARRELAAMAEGVAEIREVAGERQRTAWIALPPVAPAPLLRPRGTALITGGMGGIGAIVAHWLARSCAARLVLVGRSPGDARVAALVDAIAGLGGQAIYVPGDVADENSLARAVAAGRDRFGPLNGVIHSAGVIRDALLARKAEKDLAEVLGAKVTGARLLDRLTASDPLDCFVLFSSLTAVLGNMGQVDYGFANAFLDGFGAERAGRVARGERAGRTVSVNWPFWRDGGMRLDRRGLAALERAGLAPLDAAAGELALAAAFASGEPQVAVMAGDPAAIRSLLGVRDGAAVRGSGVPAADSSVPGIQERLRGLVSTVLKVPSGEIDADESFLDYGFDSITLAELGDAVGSNFGLDVPISAFFELTTLSALARHLAGRGAAAPVPDVAVKSAPAPAMPPAPKAEPYHPDAVAVIGMAGRFPAAPDLDAFWDNLAAGRVATDDVPADRGAWRAGDGTPYRGGFVSGADLFDPRFFGLSAHEAERMDPQQRLVLEAVWTALEDAACAPSSLAGTNTALFVGVAASDYNDVFRDQGLPVSALTGTGMAHSILVNRISFLLDLAGPSEPVDTACSSSLVAIHRAVAALRSGESDLAIAGGVNLLLTPNLFDAFAQAGMLSPTGRCRPFDRAADGYLRGEGVGVLVLKRLADALRDGDPIHAVVRGSAARHGGRSASLTAPKPEAQAATLTAAWRAAGIGPDTLGYVEAHGTGTRLGDPVEMNGIVKAFGLAGGRDAGRPCVIGSVKSNIGHLETAAGVAGVVKTVLALKHATIPATAGLVEPNPELPLTGSGLVLATRSEPWTPLRRADGSALPRRAGVSSFGFGGVNAHVVLEEAPAGAAAPARLAPRPRVFPLSAKTPEALRGRAKRLADHLEAHPDLSPADVAYTLQCGRDAYRHRAAWVATGLRELADALRTWSAEDVTDAESRDVLRAWLAGSAADWRARAEAGARKLHLPTYPFARERYWLPRPAAEHAPAPAPRAASPGRAAGEAEGIRDALGAVLAEVSGFAPALIKPDTSLEELGFDSLMARRLHARLEEVVGELPSSLPFECATLDALARRLAPLWRDGPAAPSPASPPSEVVPVPSRAAHAGRRHSAPVAVIGLAGRYPDAPDLATFWANLRAGRDSVREVPASRWPWRAYWSQDPDEAAQGRIYCRWGAFLEDAGRFDPAFFQLSAAEAELMDPQERSFLETAWAVLEDAGYPASARGRGTAPADVGVFAGVTTLSHALWGPERWKRDDMAVPADHPWSMANRVSFLLNLKGPSLPVDTACSSSLTAVHLACESLRRGETEMAIAGGVNLYMHPAKYLKLCQMRMLSPRGRCSSFGADADGFVPGEGVGAVLLKPLDRAEADGDFIHAVIRGSAVNHSGRTNGYTVPSPVSQAEVIGSALADAGLHAGAVGYVEAHGTGTALGDPLEIDGLAKAMGGDGTGPCLVGSVKSNIGHLEAAAGIAGLTKLILQLRHREIVPTLHVGTGNPAVHLAGTRFSLARDGMAWNATATAMPLTGSVSSFGAGGANAHVVVTAYTHARSTTPSGEQIVPLSARDRPTVERMARALRTHLLAAPDTRLADVAATLQLGRHEQAQRLAIRADSVAALITRLGAWLDGDAGPFGVEGRAEDKAFAAFMQDDDGAEDLVKRWAERGRLDKVAGWWALGGAVDWRSLPQIGHARRIPLPTHPFGGEVYAEIHGTAPLWRLGPSTSDGAAVADRRDGTRRHAAGIAADDPVLLDHKVDGRPILPGAAVLALAARSAAAQAAADGALPGRLLLADIAWVVPVEAAAVAELTLNVVREGEGGSAPLRFALTDRNGTEHATGRVDPNGPVSGVPHVVEPPRLTRFLGSEDLYGRFSAHGLDYGGSYRALGDVRFDDDEASAALAVPVDAAAWPFGLHPALLDAAFQVTAVFGIERTSDPVLPACLDELAVHRPVQARCRVRARRHAEGLFSVAITGEDGTVCVEAKGLRLRSRASGKAADFCYLPEWRPAEPAPRRPGTDSDLALILVPPGGTDFAAVLARTHGNARIAPIAPGGDAAHGPADFGGVDRLFVLAGIGPAAADEFSALQAVEDAILRPLVGILRGLANGATVGPKSLTIITDRVHAVHGSDRVRPWAGALAGLARAADRELTGVAVRCFDLDLADRSSWTEQATAAVAEARDAPAVATDAALAWRGGRRLVERLAPTALPARAGSDGLSTLMIIGGAGGIGLALARHFADRRGTRVALVGRRPETALAPDVRASIASNPRLFYVQGDAAAQPELERAIGIVEARVGPLEGVIHAPLVLRDRLLRGMTEADLDAVLAAKTRGLVALKAALGARRPSFVLVCSSAQSLIGAPGQAHYAAASTFQDAFAAYWDASGPYPVQVVDWGYWGEVGAVASADYRDRLAAEGVGAIGTAEGLRVVDEVLAARVRRIVPLKASAGLKAALGVFMPEAPGREGPGETHYQERIPALLARLMSAAAGDAP